MAPKKRQASKAKDSNPKGSKQAKVESQQAPVDPNETLPVDEVVEEEAAPAAEEADAVAEAAAAAPAAAEAEAEGDDTAPIVEEPAAAAEAEAEDKEEGEASPSVAIDKSPVEMPEDGDEEYKPPAPIEEEAPASFNDTKILDDEPLLELMI